MRLVKKRFRPPDRNPTAVKVVGEREICLNNADGWAERKRRVGILWKRQNGFCSLCGEPMSLVDATFEHARPSGMGSGSKDDRIYDESGNPINSAAHLACNKKKGSHHFQPDIPRGFDPEFAG